MATLPITSLSPADVAKSIGASPTAPTDPKVMGALVGGSTGLTPTALNALLGYQSDITQANTDVTAANAQGRTDTLAATQAGYQADVYGLQGAAALAQGDIYGLEAQQAQAQGDVYGLQAQQAQADADVYGLKATADYNESQGYGLQAAGYGKEMDAYDIASRISAENAALAVASGNVQKAQQQREIFKTLGSQRAQIAGAGFSGDSGTAMALYRDSVGQGNLQLAMTDLQTNVNAGSYLEASAASKAMEDAVSVAKTGAETARQNALVQQQEDLTSQDKAGLGVTENQIAQANMGLTVQQDQIAQGKQVNAAAQSELARQGALAAENTYNVAASTDATAAATAAQTASTAQVNMTNLVNTIGTTGVGTTTGEPASSAVDPVRGQAIDVNTGLPFTRTVIGPSLTGV